MESNSNTLPPSPSLYHIDSDYEVYLAFNSKHLAQCHATLYPPPSLPPTHPLSLFSSEPGSFFFHTITEYKCCVYIYMYGWIEKNHIYIYI